MSKTSSIFIFRRDFRLDDNTTLLKACQDSDIVYPIFIVNSKQVTDKNKYKSNNSIQFMHESLKDLETQTKGRLNVFYANTTNDDIDIIAEIIKYDPSISKVYSNMDYTPYAKKRSADITKGLKKKYEESVQFIELEDYMLTSLESVLTDAGSPYTKYTPYFNKASKIKVPEPVSFPSKYFDKLKSLKKIKFICSEGSDVLTKYYTLNPDLNVNGGRNLGLKIIQNSKQFVDYVKNRNDLTYKTTFLSGYIKFGCVSLREIYYGFKKNLPGSSAFFNELYWHDFYAQAIYYNPKVLEGHAMDERFDKIKWSGTTTMFEKWCRGETGFPVVDAAMKQINSTGFMHNRARMIVASLLVKTLLCDWRLGEKYFAQNLLDYDPCSNVGGWLWTAGGGFDSQPYFRIFNPWTQSEKFDKNAEYIKKWLPQLKDIPAKDLHTWNVSHVKYPDVKYTSPIVDYSANRVKALETYKKYL
jgi:deoxyribodipyrimidine photo-lyase